MKNNLESRIKEQRVAEATKKNFMGVSGKIGTILKFLGEPIISQTEHISYLDTEGRLEEEEEKIQTMYMEDVKRPEGNEWTPFNDEEKYFGIQRIGLHFDALNRGIHLEIMYKEEESELTLCYKGYKAYQEIQGELFCYIPNSEWEEHVNNLYKIAKKVQDKFKQKEFKEKENESEKLKKSWLQEIASRWGFV